MTSPLALPTRPTKSELWKLAYEPLVRCAQQIPGCSAYEIRFGDLRIYVRRDPFDPGWNAKLHLYCPSTTQAGSDGWVALELDSMDFALFQSRREAVRNLIVRLAKGGGFIHALRNAQYMMLADFSDGPLADRISELLIECPIARELFFSAPSSATQDEVFAMFRQLGLVSDTSSPSTEHAGEVPS